MGHRGPDGSQPLKFQLEKFCCRQLQKVGTLVELFWNPFLPNHFGTKIRVFAEWYWKRFGIKLDALRGRFGIGSEPVTRIVLKLFYENRNTADAHYLLPLRCLE